MGPPVHFSGYTPRLLEDAGWRKMPTMPAPVLSIAQMRAWEAATWQAGRLESEVIGRVGKLLAARLEDLTKPGDFILLLAGKGHNGDDVRATVPHLRHREWELIEVAEPAAARQRLGTALLRKPAWIVDGLFGIGLDRPLNADWVALLEQVNASSRRILAVDVPSGLNADTGETWGAAIRARITVTLGAPKAGLLRPTAWPYTGRLVVEPDIGLVAAPAPGELEWILPGDFEDFPPEPPVATHKGQRGHLLILAGSRGYHGAAVLAARAAQRARPGLITLGTLPEVYGPLAGQLQAVMVDEWAAALAKLPAVTACLIGPGLASGSVPDDLRQAARQLWQAATQPVVADASALDWLPSGEPHGGGLRVITPHPGEASRMLRLSAASIQNDRTGALRSLSERWGCWVVLKGYQTLVGRKEGSIGVNSSGDQAMAQGGVGDVLAGYLAGLLAQPELATDPATTLRYAIWRHGAAADGLSLRRRSWTPEELIVALS